QVIAISVVAVIAYAAITGDAAIHFVFEERPQILIDVGTLLAAETALGMAAHQGHVLQVAFTAFRANRAVMRVVNHQPFDDFFTEFTGGIILQRNARAVGRRRHAGHDDAALGVIFVAVLGHSTLATSADRIQLRMPAEIGQVIAQRQHYLEQVVGFVNFVLFAVDRDR